MSHADLILSRFSASPTAATETPLLFDLTLWHKWHRRRGTLPPGWDGVTEPEAAARLGAPAFTVVRPWEQIYTGIEVATVETEQERTIRYLTPAGELTARWQLGPDGDWWQVEYPVKSAADLMAARAVIAARAYRWDDEIAATALRSAGRTGVVALELPMRPYSDLLHTTLGWGEGLMLFAGEEAETLNEMLGLLEDQAEQVARRLATLPGHLLQAPDNLDGQYISPRSFRAYLQESYRRTSAHAHGAGKPLLVHAGGPVRRLLPLLVESGVDGVEGVSGPPQSDATLAEARVAAGPNLTLWGGIPQDMLLPLHTEAEFEAAVRQAAAEVRNDPRMILGVADRVSVDSGLARLQAIRGIAAAV
jgi:hypothetical protein